MADLSSILGSAGIGGQIGQAIVRLELDTAKYQAEMKAAQAQTTAGANGMSSSLAKFGGIAKAGLGVAALGVVAFGVKAISAASDLGEAVNKSNVIFGDNAAEIEKWAEGGAEAFGLSKTAALDAASGFGAMLDSAGLAADASANMSMSIVELAGDMASFNNIDPTEALEKLRSGLAGEAEPLRRFGVFLSEAAVQQEAYQSGIAKTGEELTEAQKVQARYNIIFEQTTKAQGDFQRTADSLPNQLRTMRAEFENVAAEVGTALLPIASKLVGVFGDLIPLIKVAADNLDVILAALVGFAAVKYLPGLLLAIASGLEAIGAASIASGVLNVAAAIGALSSAAGGFVGVAAAIPVAGYKIVQALAPISEEQEILNERLKEFGVVRGPGMERGLENIREKMSAFSPEIERAENFIADFSSEVEEAGDKTRKASGKIAGFFDRTGKQVTEWRKNMQESIRSSIFALEDLTSESALTEEDLKGAFRAMRQEARDFSRAMERLKDEKWINDEFLRFVSDQGPESLIQFANANEREQRRMQTQWQESGRIYKDAIHGSFLDLNDTLNNLDKRKTEHTILFRYKYEGFDPSKPGMTGGGGQSLIGGPQR